MLPEAISANVLLLPMELKGKLLEAPHALNGFAVMNVLGHGDWLEHSPCPVYCSLKGT